MKTKSCIKVVVIIFFFSISVQAKRTPYSWTSNPFEQKVFVENKGQFDASTGVEQPILFQTQSGGINIYFTRHGLVYRYDEKTRNGKNEEAEEDMADVQIKKMSLEMNWVGSNHFTEVTAEQEVSFFYTYFYDPQKQSHQIFANAYKKIIYKNLYPGIDVEYIMPEGKKGLEYSFIVHPGADVSAVKMQWSGNNFSKDASGNIIIGTAMGNFIDHAPQTFYSTGGSVTSSFEIDGNTIKFSLGKYDSGKEIIIDPWTTDPGITPTNKAYDINYDVDGNVYVYGGINPFKLVKLDAAGTVLWNYTVSGLNSSYYGDFAVDAVTGTSYLGEGFNTAPGAKVVKVNSSAVQVGLWAGYQYMREIWRMDYDYCTGRIICAGGGTSSPSYQAFVLDTSLSSSITPIQVVSTMPDIDAALLSTDNYSNNCYMLFAKIFSGGQPALDNLLVECPLPALIPTTWGTLTHHDFTEVNSITYTSPTANGFNGIAVSPNYVYTYDGSDVKKWNKNSGAFVDSFQVSPTPFSWGGLAVDECENLYVGVQSSVLQYDTTHTLVHTFPLANTIYDLRLSGNKLYACGNSFVTQIDSIETPTMQITLGSTPATCSACNGTASVIAASCSGNTNFTYLWTPGNQTTATATGLCGGTYTVNIFANCKPTFTDSVIVQSTGSLTAAYSATSVCVGDATTFTDQTISLPGDTLSWLWDFGDLSTDTLQNPQHTYSAAGNYNVTLSVTSNSGCTGSITQVVTVNALPVLNTSPPPSICVSDSTVLFATGATSYSWSPCTYLNNCTGSTVTASPPDSITYTVTGTTGSCSSTATIHVTVNPLPIVFTPPAPAICAGNSVNVSVSGGLYYHWSPQTGLSNSNPDSSTLTITVPVTTTYTVTAFSSEGCSASAPFTVTVNPNPVAVITPDGPTTFCQGDSVILTGSGGINFFWSTPSNLQSITVNTSVTVSLTVSDTNNCISPPVYQTVTVLPPPPAVISPAGPVSICTGNPVTLSVDSCAGCTYQWYESNVMIAAANTQQYMVTVAGSYAVVVTNSIGCSSSSVPVVVTIGSGPIVTITPPTPLGCLQNTIYVGYGPQSLPICATAPGAVSYLWSTNAISQCITVSQAGTYAVTAYDANGCPSTNPDTITIHTADIRCGHGLKKIIVCHVPDCRIPNAVTICIGPPAVPAHLTLHECDCLGPCSLNYRMDEVIEAENFYVQPYPNPFSSGFNLHILTFETSSITVNVHDMIGRLVETYYDVTEQTIIGSKLTPGIYFAEVLQGSNKQMVQIVKTK